MLLIYCILISSVLIKAEDTQCSDENCLPPSCQCIRIGENPTWLETDELPQLISLTFVGHVNDESLDVIRSVFNATHRNPNKCPITSTFFVIPEKIDNCLIQRLFDNQHEIALSSWQTKCSEGKCDDQDWQEEFKTTYNKFIDQTGIHTSQLKGFRLNSRRIENERYLKFLKNNHFHYDSSMVFKSSALVWPFTMNYPFEQDHCLNCPKFNKSFDALWEFPLHPLISPNTSRICRSLNDRACADPDGTESIEYYFELLMYNFQRHISLSIGQRCPWTIELDMGLLSQPKSIPLQAVIRFIRAIVHDRNYRHVYFVSLEKALEWMKNPRTINDVRKFWPFLCSDPIRFYTSDCSNNEIIDTSGKVRVEKSIIDDENNQTNKSEKFFLDLAGEKLFPSTIAFHVLWIFIVLFLTVLFYDKYLSSA